MPQIHYSLKKYLFIGILILLITGLYFAFKINVNALQLKALPVHSAAVIYIPNDSRNIIAVIDNDLKLYVNGTYERLKLVSQENVDCTLPNYCKVKSQYKNERYVISITESNFKYIASSKNNVEQILSDAEVCISTNYYVSKSFECKIAFSENKADNYELIRKEVLRKETLAVSEESKFALIE